MIEWITVSRDPQQTTTLENSLAWAHAGRIDWKLTIIDGQKHDLFSGYNAGARQTSGEILAFVHDDVQFAGSGLTLLQPCELLGQEQMGFIGAAGSRILTEEGTWWGGKLSPQETNESCRGMVARPQADGLHWLTWPATSGRFGPVVVVDGMLLMCHRRTFEKLGGFDETMGGFHFYDVDITLRAALAGMTNLVLPIPLIHRSHGNYDDAWEAARRKFVEKHTGVLPIRLQA